MYVNVRQIARICHEANLAYCSSIGDQSQLSWDAAPEWQRESAVNGVQFHLTEAEAGREPSPSASHENWLKEKTEQGWRYGPEKNVETKEHPCFLPYDELPTEQKQKDFIFIGIVKAFLSNSPVAAKASA